MSIIRSAPAHDVQSSQLVRSLIHLLFISILSVAGFAISARPIHAATITVSAGGNLQSALNAAQPGDTIVLQAGASFTGPFTLPAKSATSTDYITIRTSTPDSALPSSTTRISPADSALLPKILSPGSGQPALLTANGAHHYKLIGIEFRTVDASAFSYELVELGDGGSGQNSLDKVPHHLIVDHCLITAFPTQTLKRGIALQSAETTIENCYIGGFKSESQDAQAIAGWNGPGPFHIINNYLEASGENVMFGGATPGIKGLIPSDIEISHNYISKPLSWRRVEQGYGGVQWSVKNLLELKSAKRVLFEGNVLENCWGDVNPGYGSINLTVRGDSGPQATIEDVTVRNNLVRHTPNGFNLLGKDDSQPSGQGRNIKIINNLFEDMDGRRWGGGGEFIKIRGMPNVKVDHNTVLNSGNVVWAYGDANTVFAFTNNIMQNNADGIAGQDHASGSDTLRVFFPGAIIRRNLIVGANASIYPSDNFYPTKLTKVGLVDPEHSDYRLRPDSPYKRKATDGTDVGCNLDTLNAAIAGVISR